VSGKERLQVSDNIVVFTVLNDIFEGLARSFSRGAESHRRIELTVKQALLRFAALLPGTSAPKLRIGICELIDYYSY
jgi:hypothetical protein